MIEKLIKIQSELKAPKNQRNNFGNYNYRSCEDILEAVKPLLKENGLILRLTDELVNIGERYYIKATAILTDGNETIENVSYAREEEIKKGMDGSQITGASSSYARKYALNGLFLIDDVKDSDTTNTGIEINSKEEAGKYVITFGKNAGKTIEQIYNENKSYINWLADKSTDETAKKCAGFFVENLTKEESDEKGILMNTIKVKAVITNTDIQAILNNYNVNDMQEMSVEQLKETLAILNRKENK